MPDPNLSIPEAATPNWLLRYGQWRARRYHLHLARSRTLLPRLRTRRARRAMVALLVTLLLAAIGISIAAFWIMPTVSIPFIVTILGAVGLVILIRISTGGVADAPADALDEIQLAQRNAARSLTYVLLVPVILAIYFVAIGIGTRDQVAGSTVSALALTLISTLFAATCLPDILLTWWLPDDEE